MAASWARGTVSPYSSVRVSATAHSSAAEEDSPAPSGMSESMAMLAPPMG